MNLNLKKKILTVMVIIITFELGILAIKNKLNLGTNKIENKVEKKEKMLKFASKEEFVAYVEKNQNNSMFYGGGMMEFSAPSRSAVSLDSVDGSFSMSPSVGKMSTERYSETNVQVVGIDEPDIVKTDGKNIFYSNENRLIRPMLRATDVLNNYPEMQNYNEVSIVEALPASAMKKIGTIDNNGTMLLNKNILMVFSYDKIKAYNIEDKTKAIDLWKIDINDNNEIITSRLYKDTLYLITKTNLNMGNICPIESFKLNDEKISIDCNEIYHPSSDVNTESTYNVMAIDINKGTIEKKISFIGNQGSNVIYMSENSIYTTYYYPGSEIDYIVDFMKANDDLFPKTVIEKLNKVMSYDISQGSKEIEIALITQEILLSLSEDEQLKLSTEMENRQKEYLKTRLRDLEKTGIVKISIPNLEMETIGKIPGKLLNQFSMDEKDGNLRVAVTVGSRNSAISQSSESVSDVYVLNKNLEIMGSVKDLGKTERIYSVRFMGDMAYVVTFKETDPFYVLDLSSPTNPQLKGELKIPGYSSYLHQVDKNLILGVGKEDSQVKLSLFDVSDSSNPREIDKYTLDEYYSEILNTHLAFTQDKDKKVFFIPGTKGGYIFSYAGNKLSLTKAIGDIEAKRALYINDNLYIIGSEKIIAVDEKTWERVGELELF